jgi:aspartyl/asparaginyl beta-hydroxylase (cupin superfamily)
MYSLFYRIEARVILAIRSVVERIIAKYTLAGDTKFFDIRHFKWVAEVEAQWKDIRSELDHVLEFKDVLPSFQDISREQVVLTQDDRWKTYILYWHTRKVEANCKTCPKTAQAVKRIPGMMTAFFSILMPGKHLPEHRGPYKGVLRYHLALRVPDPPSACRIVIGGEESQWEEGHSLIFDDSFPHQAWNNSDDIRVVLFVDFKRPMKFPLSLVNDLALCGMSFSSFITEAFQRQIKWNREERHRIPMRFD